MNILILSAGTRNKIVEYFVKTLAGNGKVVATDMSKLAPAIYYWIGGNDGHKLLWDGHYF